MQAHTRALIAAATFAHLTGKKVAGLYDHGEGRDRRIAAEAREGQLQGFDGDRGVRFGGTFPEILDAGEGAYVSFSFEGEAASGYDRASSTFYNAQVADGVVQVHDHGEGRWFAYDVQDADAPRSYYRAGAITG